MHGNELLTEMGRPLERASEELPKIPMIESEPAFIIGWLGTTIVL